MSDLEHPNANRPYPTGQNRCILSETSPGVDAARAELLGSLSPDPWPEPWSPSPAHASPAERPRPPTRIRKELLPRVTDDQLLNAVDGFATLVLSTADLPHNVSSLSLDDLLAELARRGARATRADRLISLSGQLERLVRVADREAAWEEPSSPALELQRDLAVLRDELVGRLERVLRPPRSPSPAFAEDMPIRALPPRRGDKPADEFAKLKWGRKDKDDELLSCLETTSLPD